MAIPITAVIAESIRQELTGDKLYYKKKQYVFALKGPPFEGPIGPAGEAAFPLPVNPEVFEYTLPFAAEITPLQEGGVSAEENGIVLGEINLSATTGFKLRKAFDISTAVGAGDFTGLMGDEGLSFQELSGQMAFWRLANRCFEGYSQLKKDPSVGPQVRMEFYSVKDDLYLTVIPREFNLTRDASRDRVTYRFSTRLAVVGPADSVAFFPSPEEGLLQSIKNAISKVRAAVQGIRAAIDDITAAVGEIRRTISSVVSILDDVGSIASAAEDLVSGVKSFFDLPRQFVTAVAGAAEAAASVAATTAAFPADVAQSFRNLSDEIDRLTVGITNFTKNRFSEVAKKYDELSKKNQTRDRIRDIGRNEFAQKGAASGGTMPVAEAFGTVSRVGDARRQQIPSQQSSARLSGDYTGFSEIVIGQGDTLHSLAAKYLGDARKWIDIAIINGLRPPYLTGAARMPGTVRPGDNIVIPVSRPTPAPDVFTTGEAVQGKSQMEQQLGEDFELHQISGTNTWGWKIDEAGGAIDIFKVRGIANLSQAIGSRFRTEQGSNIMYPKIGLPRLIGKSNFGETFVESRHSARQQLLADKRVQKISSLKFTTDADKLSLEADIQPVGFATPRAIARTLT